MGDEQRREAAAGHRERAFDVLGVVAPFAAGHLAGGPVAFDVLPVAHPALRHPPRRRPHAEQAVLRVGVVPGEADGRRRARPSRAAAPARRRAGRRPAAVGAGGQIRPGHHRPRRARALGVAVRQRVAAVARQHRRPDPAHRRRGVHQLPTRPRVVRAVDWDHRRRGGALSHARERSCAPSPRYSGERAGVRGSGILRFQI